MKPTLPVVPPGMSRPDWWPNHQEKPIITWGIKWKAQYVWVDWNWGDCGTTRCYSFRPRHQLKWLWCKWFGHSLNLNMFDCNICRRAL